MGLHDREWFWEGYEERYGFKKTEEKDSIQREAMKQKRTSRKKTTVANKNEPTFTVVNNKLYGNITCEKCGRKFAVVFKKNRVPRAHYMICPHCKHIHRFIEEHYIIKELLKVLLAGFIVACILGTIGITYELLIH